MTADHPQVSELLNLRIYVSTDGTVFKQDVADLGIGSSGIKAKVNSKRRKEQLQSCTKTESTPPKPIVKKASAATEEGYSVVNTPHEESFEVTPGLVTNSILVC